MTRRDDHVIEFYLIEHGTEFRVRFDDLPALEEATAFLDRLLGTRQPTAGQSKPAGGPAAACYAVDETQYRAFRAFMNDRSR
jgi:hypothetical protein